MVVDVYGSMMRLINLNYRGCEPVHFIIFHRIKRWIVRGRHSSTRMRTQRVRLVGSNFQASSTCPKRDAPPG